MFLAERKIIMSMANLKHKIKDHIILIDDARAFHFKHSPDWPSLKRIYNAIKKINKNYDIFIENDIIIAQLEN